MLLCMYYFFFQFHTVAVQTESMHALGSTKQLATFIISTFFDALVEINSPTFETESVKRKEKMIKWFKAYRFVNVIVDIGWHDTNTELKNL